MPELPSAELSIEAQAVARASTSLIAVLAPCALNDDLTPRLFSSSAALLAQHGYCQGLDYSALHIQETGEPVLFVGMPIETPGVIGRKNTSGNTGTSVVSISEGASGTLEETEGVLTCLRGGTIGTDQILLGLSLDDGRTTKRIRLGTASSYTIPHVGIVINFAAGTLVAGDTLITWHSTAPLGDAAGLQAARLALASQQKQVRTWLVVGDLEDSSDATAVVTEANAYETANERFIMARAQVRDRLPFAEMSQIRVRMTGAPTLTFAEVGATGDTITRSAGSWITDGFAVGDRITVSGTGSNNFANALITAVSATVLTLDTQDLVAEVTALATVTGTPGLTFAEVGATGDTLTRSRGSWLDDGFRIGDLVVITGTASNNITAVAGIASVTALVITFDTTDLVAEGIGSFGVSVTAGETKAEHVASMDAEFASIDSEPRIDLGFGRARKASPVLFYEFRRPVAWAASIREYQHDVHITTWWKALGSLSGWSLEDTEENLVEHDERVDGGALAARFTCFRTYANGPSGPFIAMSLTRDDEGTLLSLSHNQQVANVACTVAHAATELAIGQSLVLNLNGTATTESLNTIKERVNSALEKALLTDVKKEGQRASSAKWTPSTDDILNVADAELTGVLALLLNGTLVRIRTKVLVQTAG